MSSSAINSDPAELKVGSIFRNKNYLIPLYQRNYAWEEDQTTQLVRDIWDFRNESQNYYIGTLVVDIRNEKDETIHETIDGQQRLTTLHILLSVLKHEYGIYPGQRYANAIRYANRQISSDSLALIATEGQEAGKQNVDGKIFQAYLDMKRELEQLTRAGKKELEKFAGYLFEQVRVLLVAVPQNTDLNHYFEVMNNRGEQLEKHEILKADLLNEISKYPDSSAAFTRIWEACSSMDRYMVLSFPRDLREKLFRNTGKAWDEIPDSFNQIRDIIKGHTANKKKSGKTKSTLISVLRETPGRITAETPDNEPVTRFTSVITFPNFLLHVLRATTGKDVRLDDKQLIQEFRKARKYEASAVRFVKNFGYNLLLMRLMFDKYVIKRELQDKSGDWCLNNVFLSGESSFYYAGTFGQTREQDRLVMLLAMFHVSFPQPIYKHWLSGVIRYLYLNRDNIDTTAYTSYLENLSAAFYFDKFGKKDIDYYDIIYKNNGRPKQNKVQLNLLHKGTGVQNFIFNRLDYLIWKAIRIDNSNKFNIPDIADFEFTFRSSVEHFYPQHPMEGVKAWSQPLLDQFGNLCLISSKRNSRLSNYLPVLKAAHYRESGGIESLKQKLMLAKSAEWNQAAIEEHQQLMIDLLENS